MKTVIVSKQNKAKYNPSHFEPFSFSSQNGKTQQPLVAKEGYYNSRTKNTQQRNRKSAHFYMPAMKHRLV